MTLLETEGKVRINVDDEIILVYCKLSVTLTTRGILHTEIHLLDRKETFPKLFGASSISISGESSSGPFEIIGLVITRNEIKNEEYTAMSGEADKVRVTLDSGGHPPQDRYMLLTPPVHLRSKAAQIAFPDGVSFNWIFIDQSDVNRPGILYVSVTGAVGSLDSPPEFVSALEDLLSLATMCSTPIIGVESVSGDAEYRASQPLRMNAGFRSIPNFSRKNKREELVYFLSTSVGNFTRLTSAQRSAIRLAIVLLNEAQEEPYLEAKFLKGYLALIALTREFGGDSVPPNPEHISSRNQLIELVMKSALLETHKRIVTACLRGLFQPNDGQLIDQLLQTVRLEGLLSMSSMSKVRGCLMHTAVFMGDSLDMKASICFQLLNAVKWILFRLLGYSGVFYFTDGTGDMYEADV